MLSPGSGNTVIKSKLISRRMFLITAAKAVNGWISWKTNISSNQSSYQV